jgi:hypothetical protein
MFELCRGLPTLRPRRETRPHATLNWHKREEAVRAATRAPYRLLEPVTELSYGDAESENLLIQGDNLDALKALLPYYAVKGSAIRALVNPVVDGFSGRRQDWDPGRTCHIPA